jgi:hypothetical protein
MVAIFTPGEALLAFARGDYAQCVQWLKQSIRPVKAALPNEACC